MRMIVDVREEDFAQEERGARLVSRLTCSALDDGMVFYLYYAAQGLPNKWLSVYR